ncbi:MAG TPA: hypothetical protein VFQ85_09455 [Mycobacteriales bacterium]|jgi:hypothetical protein|nr:hypothetical protein [Mycobacteriales bacterium]
MAARLELFAIADDDRLARHVIDAHGTAVPDDLHLLGYVSADDDDETLLFGLLGELAETGDLDARSEGTGFIPSADVPGLVSRLCRIHLNDVVAEPGDDLDVLLGWRDAIAASLGAATTAVAWRMRYDRGGSADDGPDEFTTGWAADLPVGGAQP